MKIGYVRVSTVEQNEARQVEALQKHDIERWYIEKISGKNLDRPKLQEMLDFAREGDTVYVLDWSRISRSTKDLLELVDRLGAKGVHLYSLKENFDTSTPHGRMVLTILGASLIVPALPYLLSFAAGAMLYVVVEELVPQAHSKAGTCGFVGGFLIMMILDVALG